MVDKVTPTLSKVQQGLNGATKQAEQLSGALHIDKAVISIDKAIIGSLKTIIIEAVNEARKMAPAINQISPAADKAANNVRKVKNEAKQTKTKLGEWAAKILTAESALNLFNRAMEKIKGFMKFADTQTGISARLGILTDNVAELEKGIMGVANASRGAYAETAEMVSKLGLLAPDAFQKLNEAGQSVLDTDRLLAFSEAVNKSLAISGTNEASKQAAMLQLTQAMSSGRLQGDELRSILEQAPLIGQTIADYMTELGVYGEVNLAQLRQLASEGKVTSAIISNAMIGSLDDIQEKYEKMPWTSAQVWERLKNDATRYSKPMVDAFNKLLNADTSQKILSQIGPGLQKVTNTVVLLLEKIQALGSTPGFDAFMDDINRLVGILFGAIGLVVKLGAAIVENWGWIGPIIWGVVAAILAYNAALGIANIIQGIKSGLDIISEVQAYRHAKSEIARAAALGTSASATSLATVAQTGLNAALLACPITWIIAAIIAIIVIIYLVVNAINEATGTTTSAMGIITGAITTAAAAIWNVLLMLIEWILAGINGIWDQIALFVNFFANVFKDPIGAVIKLFGGFADSVLKMIESVAKGIDNLIGTNLAGGVSKWRTNLGVAIDAWMSKYSNGQYEEVMASGALTVESLGLSRWDYQDAWDTGYNWGAEQEANIGDALKGLDFDAATGGIEDWLKSDSGITSPGGLPVDASGSEVTITDEDIKLLKDVAQAEWVNKYTTLRPELTVTFGDVHETADTNKLLEAMETMIENAYASALTEG